MLVTLQECLDFCDVEAIEFEITGNNNILYFKYDAGAATKVTLTNATYDGDALATHLTSVANTALSSTLAVTWSSTTGKFTIAEAAHTIQYIHSNSTAGYTIGFTEDSSAAATITSDTACSDPTAIISTIRAQVDAFVKHYCRRDFESSTYSEIYDGDGSNQLWLDQYPITAVARLSIGTQDVLEINNSTDYNYATISSDGTNLTLSLDGSDTTLAYADYTTIATLATQINATGSGWSATANATYNSFASTEIVNCYGLSCLDDQTADLTIRNAHEGLFSLNANTGLVVNSSNFINGFQNVYVTYTAGYSTIPEDLKLAVLSIVKYYYGKWNEDSFGLSGYKLDDISKYDYKLLPDEATMILGNYKAYKC